MNAQVSSVARDVKDLTVNDKRRPQNSRDAGNTWYQTAFYALYKYDDQNITVMSSNLVEDKENNLKSFLLRRLRKGAIYVGSGNFSIMEFSVDPDCKTPATCFYVSLPCWQNVQVIYCLVGPPDSHIYVFKPELQHFCMEHVAVLNTINPVEVNLEGNKLDSELQCWPLHSIDIFKKCVQRLGTNIAFVLQAALQSCTVQFSSEMDPALAADLKRFVTSVNIPELLLNPNNPLPPGTPLPIVTIKADGTSDDLECGSFCQDWAKELTKEPYSTSNIKRYIESMKLKTIKDLNTLRRLLKQAETNHYSIYSACTFLRQSGNSVVLLQHTQNDGQSPKNIISILQDYLKNM